MAQINAMMYSYSPRARAVDSPAGGTYVNEEFTIAFILA